MDNDKVRFTKEFTNGMLDILKGLAEKSKRNTAMIEFIDDDYLTSYLEGQNDVIEKIADNVASLVERIEPELYRKAQRRNHRRNRANVDRSRNKR